MSASLYWVVARTKAGRTVGDQRIEEAVLSWAVRRGFRQRETVYLPRAEKHCRVGPRRDRKMEVRNYPLLPGYLFVAKDSMGAFRAAPHVMGWLSFGGGVAQIERGEIEALMEREAAGEFRNSLPWHSEFVPKIGEDVVLEDGALPLDTSGICFVTVALLKGGKVLLDAGPKTGLLRNVVVERGKVRPAVDARRGTR